MAESWLFVNKTKNKLSQWLLLVYDSFVMCDTNTHGRKLAEYIWWERQANVKMKKKSEHSIRMRLGWDVRMPRKKKSAAAGYIYITMREAFFDNFSVFE